MHPNNTSPGGTNWATREYVYTGPTAGGVQITGQFEKSSDGSAGQGDGVNGYIELNHSTTLASFLGVNTATNQFTAPVIVGTLNTGDVLDFIVDPIAQR